MSKQCANSKGRDKAGVVGGAVLLLCLLLATLYSLPLLHSVTLGFGKVIIDGRRLRPDGLTAVDIADPGIHRTPVYPLAFSSLGSGPPSPIGSAWVIRTGNFGWSLTILK